MFLTITIDTTQEKRQKIRFNQSKINSLNSFKRAKNLKKIGLVRKFKLFLKSIKFRQYRVGKQIIGY